MREIPASRVTPDGPIGPGVPLEHPRLLGDLETTRGQVWRVQAWQALVRSALILIGLAALLALADWMWVLPSQTRGMILLGAFALAILGLFRAWPRVDPR